MSKLFEHEAKLDTSSGDRGMPFGEFAELVDTVFELVIRRRLKLNTVSVHIEKEIRKTIRYSYRSSLLDYYWSFIETA